VACTFLRIAALYVGSLKVGLAEAIDIPNRCCVQCGLAGGFPFLVSTKGDVVCLVSM
jgi:hypothetical protein